MTYSVRDEQAKIVVTVEEIIALENTLSEDSIKWAEARSAELEALNPHLREEVCYLWALIEAQHGRGSPWLGL